MIIPGIIASRFTPQGDYESIATVSVGSGGSSTITFSSIPSTYQHLQIRGISRNQIADTEDYLQIRFNGDTGSNYNEHELSGNGSAVSGTAFLSLTAGIIQRVAGSNATSNTFGVLVCDILDYKDSNKFKTIRTLAGFDNNGSGRAVLTSNLWRSTSAITSVTIFPGLGSTINQYSHFALYGIKG